MKRILLTGMSGAGKSSVIEELHRRGFVAIDTDSDEWCEWTTATPMGDASSETDLEPDWVWREDEMRVLLERVHPTSLFVSGCKSNQGKFYPLFDHVILLTAPAEVLLHRVATRDTNPYGKSDAEREQIVRHIEFVEPLLRQGCDLELNTALFSVEQIADRLVRLTD
jgi:shikimate kinase